MKYEMERKMIDEKKLIEEVESLSVTITGLSEKPAAEALRIYEREYKKTIIKLIMEAEPIEQA